MFNLILRIQFWWLNRTSGRLIAKFERRTGKRWDPRQGKFVAQYGDPIFPALVSPDTRRTCRLLMPGATEMEKAEALNYLLSVGVGQGNDLVTSKVIPLFAGKGQEAVRL